MEIDPKLQTALDALSRAVNAAVEQSPTVRETIEKVRDLGFEPNLALRLEIALEEIVQRLETDDAFELELTDEDVKTLQRMKIKI